MVLPMRPGETNAEESVMMIANMKIQDDTNDPIYRWSEGFARVGWAVLRKLGFGRGARAE